MVEADGVQDANTRIQVWIPSVVRLSTKALIAASLFMSESLNVLDLGDLTL